MTGRVLIAQYVVQHFKPMKLIVVKANINFIRWSGIGHVFRLRDLSTPRFLLQLHQNLRSFPFHSIWLDLPTRSLYTAVRYWSTLLHHHLYHVFSKNIYKWAIYSSSHFTCTSKPWNTALVWSVSDYWFKLQFSTITNDHIWSKVWMATM